MDTDIDLDELEIKILSGDFPDNPWDIILSLICQLRKKGKIGMGKLPVALGVYEYQKSTTRFLVYTRENEDGVKESIYVYKNRFENGEKPEKLEFFAHAVQ